MPQNEGGEGQCSEKQDQPHVAVDGTLLAGAHDGAWMPNRPNAGGDVGERHKNKSVQSKSSKGVTRFNTVRLTVSSEHQVHREQGKKTKGVQADIAPIPRRAPLCGPPNTSGPNRHQSGGQPSL